MFLYDSIEEEIEAIIDFLREDLGYTDAMIMMELWGIEIAEDITIPTDMKYRGRRRSWKKLKQLDFRDLDIPF